MGLPITPLAHMRGSETARNGEGFLETHFKFRLKLKDSMNLIFIG